MKDKKEKQIIGSYQRGSSLKEVGRKFNISAKHVWKVLKSCNIERRSPGEGVRLKHDHINVDPPKDFPWHLKEKFRKLIAIFLLTDGYLKERKTQFICTDKVLQRYFVTLFKEVFNLSPTTNSYMRRGKNTSILSKNASSKLLELSPSFKTCPYNQSKEDYLNSPQPSLSFLEGEDPSVIKECLRLAMSAEGCTLVEFPRKIVYPKLELSCAHPSLVKEWQKIFKEVGINSYVLNSKSTWSGIEGLGIGKVKSVKSFLEMGGFIKGVEIGGKSKYYVGIPKNNLLRTTFKLREASFHFPKEYEREKKNKIIRSIIKSSSKRRKWWKRGVKIPAIKSKAKRLKRKNKILKFIRRGVTIGKPPTATEINEKLGIRLSNYFKGKKDAYKKAGVGTPREVIRKKIINLVKDSAKEGYYLTWEDINKTLNLNYTTYFKSINEVYQLAGVDYPRAVKRKAKKPFKTKAKGKEAIKKYILKKVKEEGVIPSRKEIEENVRVKFSTYFSTADEAYKYAGIDFKRTSEFKRARLLDK